MGGVARYRIIAAGPVEKRIEGQQHAWRHVVRYNPDATEKDAAAVVVCQQIFDHKNRRWFYGSGDYFRKADLPKAIRRFAERVTIPANAPGLVDADFCVSYYRGE